MNNRMEIRPGRNINVVIHEAVNKPTAFLFHGLGGRGDQWRKQIDLLKNHYRLVIPDLYGHDKSDKPIPHYQYNPYTFIELFADVDALYKRFASDKNVLFGHSYGAAFATILADKYQEQIDKLILFTPVECIPNMKIPSMYRLPAFVMEWLRTLMEKKFTEAVFDKTTDPTLVATEMNAAKQNPMVILNALVRGMNTIPKIEITELHTPTLIFLGEHDRLILPEYSERYYKLLPHRRFEMIRNAAHMVPLERPEVVNPMIETFITT